MGSQPRERGLPRSSSALPAKQTPGCQQLRVDTGRDLHNSGLWLCTSQGSLTWAQPCLLHGGWAGLLTLLYRSCVLLSPLPSHRLSVLPPVLSNLAATSYR